MFYFNKSEIKGKKRDFFTFNFLNMDISVTIQHVELKCPACDSNIPLERPESHQVLHS